MGHFFFKFWFRHVYVGRFGLNFSGVLGLMPKFKYSAEALNYTSSFIFKCTSISTTTTPPSTTSTTSTYNFTAPGVKIPSQPNTIFSSASTGLTNNSTTFEIEVEVKLK